MMSSLFLSAHKGRQARAGARASVLCVYVCLRRVSCLLLSPRVLVFKQPTLRPLEADELTNCPLIVPRWVRGFDICRHCLYREKSRSLIFVSRYAIVISVTMLVKGSSLGPQVAAERCINQPSFCVARDSDSSHLYSRP